MVVHAFNPSTWEAEAGGFLSSRPAWSTEFQDSQGYTEKPCLKKNNNKKVAMNWNLIFTSQKCELKIKTFLLTNCFLFFFFKLFTLFIFFKDLFIFIVYKYTELSSDTPEEGVRSHYGWLWATMWLLGFELRTFGRAVGCSYPLSHLTSPQIVFKYFVVIQNYGNRN